MKRIRIITTVLVMLLIFLIACCGLELGTLLHYEEERYDTVMEYAKIADK